MKKLDEVLEFLDILKRSQKKLKEQGLTKDALVMQVAIDSLEKKNLTKRIKYDIL